jgi:hypothetical protein
MFSVPAPAALYAPETALVSNGCSLRLRYFDHNGIARVATILTTVPGDEIQSDSAAFKKALEAYASELGGCLLDVELEIEEATPIQDLGASTAALATGPRLRLATHHGRRVCPVDQIMFEQGIDWHEAPMELVG